jgi:hypothetical protein
MHVLEVYVARYIRYHVGVGSYVHVAYSAIVAEKRPPEILHLQADHQAVTAENRQREEEPRVWTPSLISRHPTPITSAAWYPSASRNNPATYCFVLGTRDRPIRLIDAYDGRVSCRWHPRIKSY